MSIEVKVPAVGESITTGTLAAWHKEDGGRVEAGEILFTLETDKVSTEVNAPESGVLRIQAAVDDEVRIGQTVALIETGQMESKSAPMPKTPAGAPPESPPPATPEVSEAKSPPPLPSSASGKPQTTGAKLPETPPAPYGTDSRITRKKLTPLRRKIATQLVMAQHTAALLTTFNECDMSSVIQLRKEMQDEFVKKHGIKLGFMSFFVKSSVDALKAVPGLNARIDGDDLVINHYFDIGVAVGTDRGLIVPVLRNCDQKSFAEIERDLADFAARAKEGKIGLDELQGGVFSVSNGGVYGSLLSTPILNPPQSGILGMHKIQDRPVAVDGKVEIRPMMYLALTYDHRVVDGKEAVTFLVRLKDCIENPARLLLGT